MKVIFILSILLQKNIKVIFETYKLYLKRLKTMKWFFIVSALNLESLKLGLRKYEV